MGGLFSQVIASRYASLLNAQALELAKIQK